MCEKFATTHVYRDMQQTSRGSLFTLNKSCEDIFGLFYRHAKIIAYVNAIILAVSGLLHLSEATSSRGMPAVLQRHKLATLKQERKGCKHQREPHKVGHTIQQRKPSIYLLFYFCCFRSQLSSLSAQTFNGTLP